MLKGLLEKSTCAECKVCCAFDCYDVWETPVFTHEQIIKAYEINPNIKISKKGNCYSFRIDSLKGDELFICPVLDSSKGCLLGDEKPFECRIWPYRVMNLMGERVIAVSPVCESVYNKPLKEIKSFLKNGLSDAIFAYADKYPEIVKEYDSSYPVIMFERTL